MSARTTRFAAWMAVAAVIGLAFGAAVPWAVKALIGLAGAAPERLPWVGTRVFAFLAFFATAGSVIYGLLLSTRILDRIANRPVTYTLHKDLALVGLGFAAVHVLLLGIDASVPYSPLEMLVPFAGPYRPLWVGVGQVALYLLVVIVGSFYVRRTIGQRAWRLLHYATFAAFLGTAVHGILAGTDTAEGWAWFAYTIPVVLTVFLLTYRIIDAAAVRDERRAAALAAVATARSAPGGGFPDRANPRSPRPGTPFPPPPSPLDLRAPRG